jgi:hypothetical protein
MGLLVLQCSAEYLQDETHLYIAVDVTDERQISKQENAWTQGGLELRIDGRADPDRSQGRGEAGDALDILISPDHVPENMILYQAQTLEQARVVAIGVPTPTGHVYEVSVPLAYIESLQGQDCEAIRPVVVATGLAESGQLFRIRHFPSARSVDANVEDCCLTDDSQMLATLCAVCLQHGIVNPGTYQRSVLIGSVPANRVTAGSA